MKRLLIGLFIGLLLTLSGAGIAAFIDAVAGRQTSAPAIVAHTPAPSTPQPAPAIAEVPTPTTTAMAVLTERSHARARARPTLRQVSGKASFYGIEYHGRKTASGSTFHMNALTAAHRSLPFGTCVFVKNIRNGRRVAVTVTDRGPFLPDRIIDVSLAAAQRLGMVTAGVVPVRLEICP